MDESRRELKRLPMGTLPPEIREALRDIARSGGTQESRNRKIDAVMTKAKTKYPYLFKAD